jgi:rod shape determining protein RodA
MATASVFDRPSLWRRISPLLTGFDGPLAFALFLLGCVGLVTMYSTAFDFGGRFVDHGRNMLIAVIHSVRGGADSHPRSLMALAVPLYVPWAWPCWWRWRCLASPRRARGAG